MYQNPDNSENNTHPEPQFQTAELENDLPSEVHVERLARPDAGTAEEIADGVGDKPVGPHRSAAGREVDTVEDIKHLRAQLHLNVPRYRDGFEDRNVHVRKAGSVEFVPR